MIGGQLREPIVYVSMERDNFEAYAPQMINGTLRAPIVTLAPWNDEFAVVAPIMTNGALNTVLLTYSNWPLQISQESFEVYAPQLIAGTMT